MAQSSLICECVVSQPFEENTYLIHLPGKQECLIVDPGLEPMKIDQAIKEKDLRPVVILNTHGHSDHIAGNEFCKQTYSDCPLIIGSGDAPKLSDPQLNLSAPFGLELISPAADLEVNEGDQLEFGGIQLEVIDAPGHSCGHVVFLCRQSTPFVVIGGDVLFQGSIGRTDFPDGSLQQLTAAIQQKLFTLPPDTIVLPGHGGPTTIGEEIRSNPFVGMPAGFTAND